MRDIHVRVDDELAEQLEQLAGEEDVPVSTIVRHAVRGHVRAVSKPSESLARAREDTGRVR
jgi:predicted transcriptional regulator